ncbi:polysaccharide biosynthesis protein GtrA [Achromatium sp. WMS3]|nr:polysaccharide biosynthesis protein GtrA [Achromatium sp. WMS3]
MLVLKYTLFAAISILNNLLFQYLSFQLYSGFGSLYLAMLIGTLAGLVTKYIFDKKWIFYHSPKDKMDDAKKFILYSFMGIFTTIIFWGTEIAFDYMMKIPNAKYVGAVIGLSIGYTIKYYLDKKYVFTYQQNRKSLGQP